METQDLVTLQGFIFDIEGNPLETEVSIKLNKKVTKYKTTLSVSGEEQIRFVAVARQKTLVGIGKDEDVVKVDHFPERVGIGEILQ